MTYVYRCKRCGFEFEKIMTVEEMTLSKPKCPQCNSQRVRKIISSPQVNFVGPGFYVNDKKPH